MTTETTSSRAITKSTNSNGVIHLGLESRSRSIVGNLVAVMIDNRQNQQQ